MAAGQCAADGWSQAALCFFGLGEGIRSYRDVAGLIALTALLLGLGYNLVRTTNAFLLLRRMHPGESRGSILSTLLTIVELMVVHPLALFSPTWNLFVRMRMRVEHEIFDPRPNWEWPIVGAGPHGLAAYWRAFGAAVAARARWHGRMAAIGKRQAIRVETAGDVNGEFEAVRRYFETIRTLRFVDRDELSFLCPLEIGRGFIAPLHLLTGLLAQYDEKWDGIIAEFQRQTDEWSGIPLPGHRKGRGGSTPAENFRQIQSFIYHCWLLWGPSIPICKPSCGYWLGAYVSIQYGFGDENNSIEIVGNRATLVPAVAGMVRDYFPGFEGMAIPASVSGVLQYSTTAQRNASDIPPLIEASWGGAQDARPILFYSERQEGDAHVGRRAGGDATVGAIRPEMRAGLVGASHYYSAYLWVMFVVLREHGPDDWRPLDADPGANPKQSTVPWQTTIPFFEHGNIADGESCAFAKQMLADKVLSAIRQFVADSDLASYPLRFAYASAIDDANCGMELEFDFLRGGGTIRQLIERRLKDAPWRSSLARLRSQGIIRFDYFDEGKHGHPHSACALPFQVGDYYAVFGGGHSASAARKLDGEVPSSEAADSIPESAPSSGDGSSSATASPA